MTPRDALLRQALACIRWLVFGEQQDGPAPRASDTIQALRKALDAPATAPATIQLGAYGAAYDPPGTKRAYTYEHQPGNDIAYRLGEAVKRAAAHNGGDQIDTGLMLLKALADCGFGVFGLGAETASHPQAQRARYKVVEGSESAHCCFRATVVDTSRRPDWCDADDEDKWEAVCECFEREEADRIAAALNASIPPPEQEDRNAQP